MYLQSKLRPSKLGTSVPNHKQFSVMTLPSSFAGEKLHGQGAKGERPKSFFINVTTPTQLAICHEILPIHAFQSKKDLILRTICLHLDPLLLVSRTLLVYKIGIR